MPVTEQILADLEQQVKQALKKHDVESVLACLQNELWQLECSTLYATKGGILGTPDYDQLQKYIHATKQVIAKLENGTIKPPKRMKQAKLDDFTVQKAPY